MPNRQPRTELEAVFVENRKRLEITARKIVRSPEQAEDIVQDAFVKILNLADTGKVERPLSYCHQVVRNLAIDHCRRQSLEAVYRIEAAVADYVEPQQAAVATPEQLLIDRRALQAISQALDALPARTRYAFELGRLGGLTQREIAGKLGCSATLVNFILKEADAALQACRTLLD